MAPVSLYSAQVSRIAKGSLPQPVHFVMVHGFLSHGGSLTSLARRLHKFCAADDTLQPVVFFAVDCRNHGRSPHTKTHTLDDMVADLHKWLDHSVHVVPGVPAGSEGGPAKVIAIGHSMGSLVWTKYMMDRLNGNEHRVSVAALISLDMPPLTNALFPSPLRGLLWNYMELMKKVNLSAIRDMRTARAEFTRCGIHDKEVQGFFTTNLKIDRGGSAPQTETSWRCNLPVLTESLREGAIFMPEALTSVTPRRKIDVPVLSIMGGRSAISKCKHLGGLWSTCATTTEEFILPKAGHNICYDDLDGTASLIESFIKKLSLVPAS
uniref:AB hydrolase-1 domain-containing protein n=1 Tax=Trypanosoma congolense (strain IL3000) TaxID=1068625 RepID=G0UPA5_TRYCI|nr:conserved hypothetical protein [Trypanosoma congolense IL3000]